MDSYNVNHVISIKNLPGPDPKSKGRGLDQVQNPDPKPNYPDPQHCSEAGLKLVDGLGTI